MKTVCRFSSALCVSVSILALGVALQSPSYAASDPLFDIPSTAPAKIADVSGAVKPVSASVSSSAVPSSGASAVPSASSSLASPSSALQLPMSSTSVNVAASSKPASSSFSQSATGQPPATTASLANILATGASAPTDLGVGAGKDDSKKEDTRSLNAIEARVSDSVKDVVKHLGAMTETTTLEDINVAKQAVAKLEAMIDIEKRLAELEKMRGERLRGGSLSPPSVSVASAIAASALLPLSSVKLAPPSQMISSKLSSPDDSKAMNFSPAFPTSSYELSRIVGSNGRYRAVIKAGEGAEKTYRAGDKLPDGSVVLAVTQTSVVLKKDGSKNTLRIKGVDMVFNGR